MVWFRCSVEKAGPGEDGIVYIALTDLAGGFYSRWFSACATIGGLATAASNAPNLAHI